MPRPRKVTARYVRHTSGKARAIWYDPTGIRRERLLPGPFNSPESVQAFAELQLDLAGGAVARGTSNPPRDYANRAETTSVAEVLVPYLRHATGYYGPKSGELRLIKTAMKTVRELFGLTPVTEFGPKKLSAVREAFVQKGWSRGYVNRQIGTVTRAFKWAVAEELAPGTVYQAMKALSPLRRGHCSAPDLEPRLPANPQHVAATLPYLTPHVRAIVELLRQTGMRPSEVCKMTLGQIDRAGPVWFYRPTSHKNEHRGHHRMVALGAAAQAIICAQLDSRVLSDVEPLFSPLRQREARFTDLRAKRKTKIQPSQSSRRKSEPIRLPGLWFTSNAVAHAVAKACRKAGVKPWSPYQLRHLKGMELREKFSLEHVRAALGHSHAAMSAHYAKGADVALATEVAAAAG